MVNQRLYVLYYITGVQNNILFDLFDRGSYLTEHRRLDVRQSGETARCEHVDQRVPAAVGYLSLNVLVEVQSVDKL